MNKNLQNKNLLYLVICLTYSFWSFKGQGFRTRILVIPFFNRYRWLTYSNFWKCSSDESFTIRYLCSTFSPIKSDFLGVLEKLSYIVFYVSLRLFVQGQLDLRRLPFSLIDRPRRHMTEPRDSSAYLPLTPSCCWDKPGSKPSLIDAEMSNKLLNCLCRDRWSKKALRCINHQKEAGDGPF